MNVIESESLTPERGRALVDLAKGSIAHALGVAPAPLPPRSTNGGSAWLEEHAATFVTLFHEGELQGCIGSIEPRRKLVDDVQENAVAAAFRDPRFPGIRPDQLDELRVEVSVLSPLEKIPFRTEEEALAAVRPFVDGLVVRHGWRRGVLLPQVWDRRTSVREFVAALKMKAGLPPTFWAEGIELHRFTLRKFVS